jgi:hypothetical protein
VDRIERFSISRRAGFKVGMLMSVLIGFAIFVLGAPPWILVPVSLAGATALAAVQARALHKLEEREKRSSL